jgi:hypothetical protein
MEILSPGFLHFLEQIVVDRAASHISGIVAGNDKNNCCML